MGPLERITLGLAPVAAAGGWADADTCRADGRFRLRAVQALLENANHIYQPVLGSNDVGKDAYVDIVVDGDVSGDVIALQIKGGESFRRARGYAIPCTAADRELWRLSSIPVFGVVHDAGKLHWTNLTAWARALASDMRPAAAPVEATFALDERRLPGFLGQARAYLRADGPLRCAPAAPAASFSAVHADRAALAPAIQVLTLTVGHGDIFWTPDNWLPEPFATPSAASFAGPQPRSSS